MAALPHQYLLLLLLLLLPLLLLLSPSEAVDNGGDSRIRIVPVTREIPIMDDVNFVIQCSVTPQLQLETRKIYWKWDRDVLADLKDETRRLDKGNGTLVIRKVLPEYSMIACIVNTTNGTELTRQYMYMVFNPLKFVRNFVTHEDFVGSFTEPRKLEPGYETTLYCYAHCSCQYDRKWFVRVDGGSEQQVDLERDVDQMTVALLQDSNASLYNLTFRQAASRSGLQLSWQVATTARIQVLCRLLAFTDAESIRLHPVLKFTDWNATATYQLMLPPPQVTTLAPSTEHCSALGKIAPPLPEGHLCREHLTDARLPADAMVDVGRLVNTSAVLGTGPVDREMTHLAHCAALAQALLCQSALCDHRPCRQHCLLVRDYVCPAEVKLLRHFPACEQFPDAESEPACQSRFNVESVMRLRSQPAPGASESDTSTEPRKCFSRRDFWRGIYYRAPGDEGERLGASPPPRSAAVTATPPGCADWSQSGNRLVSQVYFTSLKGAGRACRNPGAMFHRPSCVDRSDTKFFLTCQVIQCEETLALNSAAFGLTEPVRAVIIVVSLTVAIVIAGCAMLAVRLRNGRLGARDSGTTAEESVSLAQSHMVLPVDDLRDANVQRNVKFGQKTHLAKTYPKLERLAYSHDDFTGPGKEIGRGAFFTVYLVETAKYKEERPDMPKTVALKVLDEAADDQIVESFFSEAELLLGIEHRYVMQVFGICASTRPFCLLVEYCEFGDLQTLLRKSGTSWTPGGPSAAKGLEPATSSPSSTPPPPPPQQPQSGAPRPLELRDLLRMASQVANALSYISKRGLVFRDLASRNILVTSGYDVRLADFGMCRKLPLGTRTSYSVSESEQLPVRWLAPETVVENRFYLESDVYAFGVLLWELFSMGQQPWTGMTVEQVWEMKQRAPDSKLPRPERATDDVWSLMCQCWSPDMNSRPGFGSLTYQLHQAATHC